MANKIKKNLSLVLVMCMLISALPTQALAADGTEPDTKLDLSGSVVAEVHPSSTNTYYDENGVPTVEITIQQTTTSGTSADGATVTGQQTVTDTTTFHPDGSVQIETAIDGSEKKEWTDLELAPGQEVPDIKVDFSQSGTVSGIESETYKDPDFVIPSDGEYDMSRTETTVNRDYSATVGGLETDLVVGGQKTDLYSPAGPSDYEGKQYVDWAEGKKHNSNYGTGPTNGGYQYDTHYFEGVFNNGDDYYINKEDNQGNALVAPKPEASGENANIDQGYDFLWSGSGDATWGSIPVFAEEVVWLEVVYKTDSEGNTVVDKNGDPVVDPIKSVVDMEKTKFVRKDNGKMSYDYLNGATNGKPNGDGTGMVCTPGQFALMNEYGQYFYAYCMDAGTGTSPEFNSWYQLRNLEDAIESEDNPYGYISEDEAAMIRAIALNGYWGTDPNVYETNEDGSIKYEPVLDENGNPVMEKQFVYEYDEEGKLIYEETEDGKLVIKRTEVEVPVTKPVAKRNENGEIVTDPTAMGSIASLKQLMLDTYNAESSVTVRYPGSNEGHEVSFYELIDGLTEAEALAVTQAAIWAFANANDPLSGTVVGVLSASKYHNGSGSTASYQNEYRPLYYTDKDALESDARMQALYELFLTKLEPIYENDDLNKASDIVPSGEAIRDVAVVIKDKVEEHSDNQDENEDNDVYNSDISFTLAFVPDKDSDDMLVYLYNGTEVMRDSNGDPIVRRLSGTNDEGEDYRGVEYDEATGSYLLTGLQLSENTDYSFNLKLEGVQHLDKGVYIYQAHGGERSAGQTLVGLVEGDQYFEASATMTLNFEVTETNDVVVERVWHDEHDPITYPPQDPTTIEEEPVLYRLTNNQLEEIPDEEVPLAAPVITGDNSFVLLIAIAMTMLMLLAINLPMAKRPRGKHEAI